MLRLPLVFAAAALGMMLAIDLAYGQVFIGPAGGPSSGMRGGGMQSKGDMISLLQRPQVQKELALSDEQKAKVQELQQEEMSRGGFGGPAVTNMPGAPGPKQEQQKRLATILQPEQLKRLKEVSLQVQGIGALKLPEVAKELGVDTQQQTKLKIDVGELEKQLSQQRLKIIRDHMSGALPEERDSKRAEAQREINKLQQKLFQDALSLLTPEQREKFEKMRGKSFELASPLQQKRPGPGKPNVPPANQSNVQPPS
jgi:hypothetical protein